MKADAPASRPLAPSRRPPLPVWSVPALGLAAMAVPTLASVARQSWSKEAGAHGPIVLATGAWLLFHASRREAIRRDRGADWRFVFAGATGLWLLYAFGRAFDFLALEVLAAWGMLVCMTYRLVGPAELRRLAFPLFYLAFLVPLPGPLLRQITEPLKMLVSTAATAIVAAAGYPAARQGVSISVAQYQFLVEDACSGLNSLTGLIAISLFYIYVLHRGSPRYALQLLAVVIPVAVAVNIVRVIALILMTYHYGDEVAQGFMHAATGLILYGGALALIFALDMGFQRLRRGRQRA